MTAEQIDIFGGLTDVTPAPRPTPKPAAAPTPQLSLFDLDGGNYAGQTVAIDAGFSGIATEGTEVAGDNLLTW